MLFITVVVVFWGLAAGYPQHVDWSNAPLSDEDREFLDSLPSHRGSYPADFQLAYVDRNGTLAHGAKPPGEYIRIIGSPKTRLAAMQRAAQIIHKMLQYSPPEIFTNLARHNAGLGIFTAAEKLTIFPEYAPVRDRPECTGTCRGACRNTCVLPWKKWGDLTGVTGPGNMSLAIEENIMCDNDPHHNKHSTTVHEFAHAVDFFGLDHQWRAKKTQIYNDDRGNSTWKLGTYAMVNNREFFAEATSVFFDVEKLASVSGGMNECYGRYQYCRTEMEARHHILQVDPSLYDLLSHIYTDHRPTLPSRMTICSQDSSVVG